MLWSKMGFGLGWVEVSVVVSIQDAGVIVLLLRKMNSSHAMIEFWHLRLLSVGTISLLYDGQVEKSRIWKATWSSFGEYGSNKYSKSTQLFSLKWVEVFHCSSANEVHVETVTVLERLLVHNGDYIQDWVSISVPLVSIWCKTEPLLLEGWTLLLELLELHLCFVRSSHLSMTGVTISVNRWCQFV